jgi:CheY-like chemotaxis protein
MAQVLKVLVVDDVETMRKVTAGQLAALGCGGSRRRRDMGDRGGLLGHVLVAVGKARGDLLEIRQKGDEGVADVRVEVRAAPVDDDLHRLLVRHAFLVERAG